MSSVSIQPTLQGYAVMTPRSSGFLADFKRLIPAADRSFSGKAKAWYVAPKWRTTLVALIEQHFGERLEVKPLTITTPPTLTKELRIEYLGQCKVRDNGVSSASGSVADEWLCILPETVLRAFFNQTEDALGGETPKTSLYATLGITQTALAGDIKSAFRRLARQWHPDICKEDGAGERFQKLDHAYKMLSDPARKRKYDAGLAMAAATSVSRMTDMDYIYSRLSPYGTTYQPPLRCGLINAEWSAWLGKYTATRIISWGDIPDEQGRVMTSMWPRGAEKFTIRWVTI